jgi:hypothetical protein
VTHQMACLMHFLAAHGNEPQMLSNHPELMEALPAAIKAGVVRHPGASLVDRDRYWVILTDDGERLVSESLCTMETLA